MAKGRKVWQKAGKCDKTPESVTKIHSVSHNVKSVILEQKMKELCQRKQSQ
jgi:hypothetical protein